MGPENAKILIITDAPDREDEKYGVLFSGSAGRLFDSLLYEAGIKLNQCRVLSLLSTRPYRDSFAKLYSDKQQKKPTPELLEARRRLREEVKKHSPNVIIPLGVEPLRALMEEEVSGEKWRGSILQTKYGKVVPVFSPERLQRQFYWSTITKLDLKKAKEESLSPEISLPQRRLETAPDLKRVLAFIEECRKAPYLAFDIETIPRTHGGHTETHIDCIGFAISESWAMCIPLCEYSGKPYWSVEEEIQVWNAISSLLYDPGPKKIAQNGQYDILILERFGIQVRNYWADTLNMAHTLHSEFPKNLDFLVSVYTRDPYYGYMISEGSTRWRYNAKDVALTYEIAFKLLKDMEEFGVKDFYFQHVHPLLPIYIEAQKTGVLLDENARELAIREIETIEGAPKQWVCSDPECKRSYYSQGKLTTDPPPVYDCCLQTIYEKASIEELQTWLWEYAGFELNVNSPKQITTFLYDTKGFPEMYNKKGNPGADEEILETLYKKYHRKQNVEFLRVILAIRAKRKLLSTYLRVKTDADGRVRSSYMVTGTETGRLAASKSVDDTGWNAQNVPKGPARRMIIADPGCVFVGADSRQAEARAVAYFSGDSGLIEIIESGKDIYREAAVKLFDKPESEITPPERALAKTGVLSANYGVGPRTFGVHAGISEKESKAFLKTYFETFPKLKMYHRDVETQLKRTRTLINPFGRKRRFHDRISDTLFREAYAFLPQSGVVDMIHRATRRIYERLPQGAQILLQTHDSLTIQCLENDAEKVKQIVMEAMTEPWTIGGRTISIPAEADIGGNWNEV